VTAIATGGAGGDAAVVLDDTTMWREFQVAGASHERDADGTLVRCAVYPNIATAEAKDPAQVKGCRISLDYWGGVFGLDLFPLKRPVGGYFVSTRCYGTRPLSPGRNTVALLYPGPDGPVATERFEMFREGTELTEALLDVEQAIAEKKLSADLLERATRYRDERARSFNMGFFPAIRMQSEEDAKLLGLAGEVAKELGKK
jgi:hypothetical protein